MAYQETLVSSGVTAIATSSNSAVEVIAYTALNPPRAHFTISNEGSVAGFFSVDGANWVRIQANTAKTFDGIYVPGPVQIKRVEDGSNMTDVYAEAW
jgi:hypothetical protein